MIRKLCLALSLIVSTTAFAAPGFEPIHFQINKEMGGIGIENTTDKTEIVQVNWEQGVFGAFKVVNGNISCDFGFGYDDSHETSAVCLLEPKEKLSVEIDMIGPDFTAEGTYQVSFLQ